MCTFKVSYTFMPDIQEAKCFEFSVQSFPPVRASSRGQKNFALLARFISVYALASLFKLISSLSAFIKQFPGSSWSNHCVEFKAIQNSEWKSSLLHNIKFLFRNFQHEHQIKDVKDTSM